MKFVLAFWIHSLYNTDKFLAFKGESSKMCPFSTQYTLEHKTRNKGQSYAIHNVHKFRNFISVHIRQVYLYHTSIFLCWKELKKNDFKLGWPYEMANRLCSGIQPRKM
jgi:hypothetical protein